MTTEKRRGLTLVEALVVIVILAILASFMFPVINYSRPVARRSACQSNLKQLGAAFAMYLADYDGVYPISGPFRPKIMGAPPAPPAADPSPEGGWTAALRPYLNPLYVLRCPSDRSKRPAAARNPDPAAGEYASSFAVNAWSEYRLSQSAVRRPERGVLVGERNNLVRTPRGGWQFYWWTWQSLPLTLTWPPTDSPDPTPRAAADLDLKRHEGRANWLYGDGHVKIVTLDQLWRAGEENAFCGCLVGRGAVRCSLERRRGRVSLSALQPFTASSPLDGQPCSTHDSSAPSSARVPE